jgi:2-aminoadipate transaminase
LYYDTPPPPAIRAFDDHWVFYVGSFSKILAPGLRVGWIIAPQSLMSKLSVVKEASDINTSTLAQHIISAYIDEGHLPSHLDCLRREYKTRRDSMLRALEDTLPSGSGWKKPNGGLFIWVELPEAVDTKKLLAAAIETEGIAFIPGASFSIAGGEQATNCMRLNFSNCPPMQIMEGISRLGRALKKLLP